MGIVTSIVQMIAKVLLNLLSVHIHSKLLSQSMLDRWFGCLEQSLVLRQLQVGLFAPAEVVNRGLGLMVLVQRIFFAEDQHSQDLQPFVEMVELTHAIRHCIQKLHVCEELSDAELWKLHRSEEPSIALLQKQMMHQYPLMIIVKQPLGPPLSRVVSVLSDSSLDEGHQSSVPMIHYSGNIDVPLHVLWMFGDEVGGVDAAQGVSAEDHSSYFQISDESNQQKGEMFGRAFVGAASLVLAVKAGDGEIDPSATFPRFFLQPSPLHMVSGRSMQRQNSMPVLVLAVSDVAVPPVAKIYSFLGPWLIQSLLLLCEHHSESLQIALHKLLHEAMLPLALLLGPFVDDMVVLLL